MTISHDAHAYAGEEIARLSELIGPLTRLQLDPVRMPHSAGTCELWATLEYPGPAIMRGGLCPSVHEVLAGICRALGDWWRSCESGRSVPPEVVGVYLEFADVRIAFDSDGEPGSYLARPEIVAIPALLSDVARRLAPLLSPDGAPSVCVGIRTERTESGAVRCFPARYWQLGRDQWDPDLIYDSWRDWIYRRTKLTIEQ
jgi:hypothetical protein